MCASKAAFFFFTTVLILVNVNYAFAENIGSCLAQGMKAITIAVGDPFPRLVPQTQGSGIEKDGVYHTKPTRYILKKAHLSLDDFRVYDVDGNLVANSHHPGKVSLILPPSLI